MVVYMLAPMEDVTDTAMRKLCHNHGADVTFTEMARIDSLARKNKSTLEKTQHDDIPTWIQLVGANEQQLKRYLHDFEPQKGFQGFNLNLGCPSQNLVSQGIGCAMVRRISKTRKLLATIKDNGYRTSIKMRLGLTAADKQKKVYLHLIEGTDADLFIIHARTAADQYETAADHSIIPECARTRKTIIANGDITTAERVNEVVGHGAQGVMIGRSAICNPGIFTTLKGGRAASIEELTSEYMKLASHYNSAQKYRKNVLKHLGKSVSNNEEKVNG